MELRKTNLKELEKAMELLNQIFQGNITFNRLTPVNQKGDAFNVTLRVKDSRGAGARRGYTGRRLINACYHVHGYFFQILFMLNPQIQIKSLNNNISEHNIWGFDRNIGSIMNPLYLSDACNCDIDAIEDNYINMLKTIQK